MLTYWKGRAAESEAKAKADASAKPDTWPAKQVEKHERQVLALTGQLSRLNKPKAAAKPATKATAKAGVARKTTAKTAAKKATTKKAAPVKAKGAA